MEFVRVDTIIVLSLFYSNDFVFTKRSSVSPVGPQPRDFLQTNGRCRQSNTSNIPPNIGKLVYSIRIPFDSDAIRTPRKRCAYVRTRAIDVNAIKA